MRTKRIFLTLLLFSSIVARGEKITFNANDKLGTCEGWGVSLCWWAAQCGQWPEERLDSLIDWLVSPDGLNYNVFRYNIGGGDDPSWSHCQPHHFGLPGGKGLRAEIEGFQDADGTYHWERDSTQRKIMLMIKRKRPDAVFEAFSNSAPWWMTVSGCCAGASSANDDNVSPQMYEQFATYLITVCKHYKEAYGIEFATLDPFNEPMTNYWYQNGGQEGCHFDVASQIAFLRVLSPLLRESGLQTVVSASDETDVEQSVRDIEAYSKAGVLSLVGQWNTHTYKGTNESKARLQQLCDSLGIRLWQSETGDGGRGLMGNLRMAQRLVNDIRYLKPAVWCDWQYVEENFDQWSLVKCNHDWSTYKRHKNYYVRQHFSRFIPVGYQWIQVNDPYGLASCSPDGTTLTYVTLNASRHSRDIHLSIPKGMHIEAVYRTSRTENCRPIKVDGPEFSLSPESIITVILKK